MKTGIGVNIPGIGVFLISDIVTDYTGTHSYGGRLSPGVKDRLIRIAEVVDIHVLTSDTFGTVKKELQGVPHTLHILDGKFHDLQKERFVGPMDSSKIAAFGNGMNDRLMLKAVKETGGLAVAVDNGEGCALDAILNSHLLVHGSANALDLLLEPNRLKATLRF